MAYFIWTFRLVFMSLALGFLHYTLPQHDIFRIMGTDIIRRDFGGFNQFSMRRTKMVMARCKAVIFG